MLSSCKALKGKGLKNGSFHEPTLPASRSYSPEQGVVPMKTDPELMADFRRGDAQAFDVLVARHQTGLLNFFFRLVWDRQVAEDLSQEVLLRLFAHSAGYEPRAKFTTYMYRIARNCWVDHLRRTKGDRKTRSLDAESEEGRTLAETLAIGVEDPSSTVKKSELADAVVEAVDELQEEHKLVFILSEVQGLKYHEIGETLGVPVGTVKSRMFHAVKRLKDKLGRSLKNARGPWRQTADKAVRSEVYADTGGVGCAASR
jgi:RNA polymerase sigma-70 factor, ECF subfamily